MHFIEHRPNYEFTFVVYKLDAQKSRTLVRPPGRHSGDVIVGNVTFLMIFAVFDPSPLPLRINFSFSRPID